MEYFRGTLRTSDARWIIDTGANSTPTVVLAELKKKYVADGLLGFESDLATIKTKSSIAPLYEETALLAGEVKARSKVPDIGIVDCILIALARQTGMKVLTGDKHFVGLPEATMI